MFQQCFNFNRIHDSIGKTLRTADQDHVTVNSHALSFSSDACLKLHNMASAQPFYNSIHWPVNKGLNEWSISTTFCSAILAHNQLESLPTKVRIFYGKQRTRAAFSQQTHFPPDIITELEVSQRRHTSVSELRYVWHA